MPAEASYPGACCWLDDGAISTAPEGGGGGRGGGGRGGVGLVPIDGDRDGEGARDGGSSMSR